MKEAVVDTAVSVEGSPEYFASRSHLRISVAAADRNFLLLFHNSPVAHSDSYLRYLYYYLVH